MTPVFTDEVLGGAERYTIKEDGGAVFKDDMQIILKTSVSTPGTPMSAALMNLLQNMPEGTMINGKIVPSVASNNLTLTLKTVADGNPSASDPVLAKVSGVLRVITAALSVTKNAGTNWCNAGGAELATKTVDYFAYLGYNATDGVVLGFSRIPYANQYNNFSTTSTNEKYAAISTITNAAAGDAYVNIGRFAATLSAGAGYTWTTPGASANNLIQRPIFETRWLDWAPAWTNVTVGNGTQTAQYKIVYDRLMVKTELIFGSTSSVGGAVTSTLPITVVVNSAAAVPFGFFEMKSAGAIYLGMLDHNSGGNTMRLRVINTASTYAGPSALSATVPGTWTTSDEIDYFIPGLPIA